MSMVPSTRDLLTLAAARKVVLCVGPGGVGKTTCAAALALGLAQQGRRVLVVTIDPSRRLAQALGFNSGVAGGTEMPVALPGGDGRGSLSALWLAPDKVFGELVQSYADAATAASILKNPLYQAMAENLGGAIEYAAMAKLQLLHASGRHDIIVLDTPPTANAIDFLTAPERLHELATNPATRLIAGGGKLGSKLLGIGNGMVLKALGAIAGGSFLSDLGAFLRDFSGVLAAFQARGGDFQALLTSPATGVVLATSTTAFSVREALEFLQVLVGRGMHVDSVVLNRVLPPFAPAPADEVLAEVLAAEQVGPVKAAYAGLQAQGERALAASRALSQAYPNVPLWLLPQREPPPTALTDLQELVAQMVRFGG